MASSLPRLKRLLSRAAVLSVVYLTMLLAVGAPRVAVAAEGSNEESVHAAHEHASVLWLAVTGGDADDDGVADALPSDVVDAGEVPPANATGVRAIHTEAPTSPSRFLPAARGPPTRA